MAFDYQGVLTALITPFSADGAVDIAAFERLAHRQLQAGIHGLVVCGTTGETPTLAIEEQDDLIAAGVRVAAGSAPVLAGVGTNDTRSTRRAIERAAALGVDAGLLVFPYYNKPNPDGLRQHVRACLAPGLPLMLYHVPGRTGQRLSASLLAELCDLPGVIGLKEATGDIRLGADVIAATRAPVLSGDDFTFLGLMAHGGAGVVSVLSNVAPAQTVEVWRRHRSGDPGGAAASMRALWPLTTYLFDDVNPVPCKAALETLGLCRRDTRLPLAPAREPAPRAMLEALGLLGC
jgi:4-hydroxy-tetrahydrodipicolinate synthase